MTTSERIGSIMNVLNAMPIGATGTRFDVVVTRWSATAFELDTWGRTTVGLYDAAVAVAEREVRS